MLTTVIHSMWTENVSYTDSAFSETGPNSGIWALFLRMDLLVFIE